MSVLPKLWPGNFWLAIHFSVIFCTFPKVNSGAIQPSIIPALIYKWEAAWNTPW